MCLSSKKRIDSSEESLGEHVFRQIQQHSILEPEIYLSGIDQNSRQLLRP